MAGKGETVERQHRRPDLRAGNIQPTPDALRIHRAMLYQQLKRIERLTGCGLDRGDDRLTLHIGLKLPATHPEPGP